MAPHRRVESEEQVSSSEEEDDEILSEENEEEEEEEEEEEVKISPITASNVKRPSTSKKTVKSPAPAQSQSSSTDAGSDSGSEPDTGSGDLNFRARKSSDHNVKPLASKRMKEAANNPRSKSVKRENPSNQNRDESSKKLKTKSGSDEEKPPKQPQSPHRLWNEENEIVVLEGLIEYKNTNGAAALADMNAFYEFMKNKLQIVVSKNQLSDKVRRLRVKYKENSKRGKKGRDRHFSKDHEQKSYELSKKVWGPSPSPTDSSKKQINGTVKNHDDAAKAPELVPKVAIVDSVEVARNAESWLGKFSIIGDLGKEIFKDGIQLLDEGKRLELEDKIKKLRVEEIEVYLKRVELIHEQTKLVLEALKSSSSGN